VLSYNAYGAVRTPRTERRCRTVMRPYPHQRTVCRLEKVGEWKQLFDGVDGHQFRFVDVLADRIAAERPQLVGLQEMCGSQVNHLEWALASRGYPMVAYFDEHTKTTNEMRCSTNEGRWPSRSLGKAILVQGQATPAAPGGFDARGVPQVDVCVHWQGPMPIRFCSVHTGPDRIPAVASGVNGWARAEPVIVVGDFNAEPDDAVMDTMYKGGDEDPRGRGSFYEADTFFTGSPGPWSRHERCGERTNRGLIPEKIDYVFLDAEHFEKPASPAARRKLV
jgi:endonuclease/exonuclease/phosphatase family metal-dependent hydrolase